jgi:parallel beta-helix repeat protein
LIPPFLYPNYQTPSKTPDLLVTQNHTPYPFVKQAMLFVFPAFRHSPIVYIGAISIALMGVNPIIANAQIPRFPDRTPLGEKTSQVSTIFVNPSTGDDNSGNGSDRTPFRTITQALRIAQPNTVIILNKGNYSAENGESFPLILKQGQTIQGDPANKGQGINIQGNGEFLSRSYGSKQVAIIGAPQAKLIGVTLSNNSPRGYGLWIESTTMEVSESTFSSSTQDGITILGNNTSIIRNNNFYRNGANGITVTGNARPEIRGNLFQETGFGINVTQNAQPVIVDNQIQNNRSGIIVQSNSRPVLRNNLIANNKEDGLVVIFQAQPDLGNTSEPGGNDFRDNGRYDINANAAKQLISAYGNNLANNRIAGKVDISGTAAPITENRQSLNPNNNEVTFSAPTAANPRKLPPLLSPRQRPLPNSQNLTQETPVNGEVTFSAPSLSGNSPQSSNGGFLPTPRDSQFLSPRINPRPSLSGLNDSPTSTNNTNINTTTNINPIPSFTNPRLTAPSINNQASANDNQYSVPNNVIEFVAPESNTPPFSRSSVLATNPVTNPGQISNQNTRDWRSPLTSPGVSGILPVPDSNIPVGNPGRMRRVPVSQTNNRIANNPNYNQPIAQNNPQNNLSDAPLTTQDFNRNTISSRPNINNNAPQGQTFSNKPSLTNNTFPTNYGTRYRVVVEIQSDNDQQLVQFLVPGSFRTTWEGRGVMQAGVFSNRYNADEIVRLFNTNGLRALVQTSN